MREICKTDDAELAAKGYRMFPCFNGKLGILIRAGETYHAFVNS